MASSSHPLPSPPRRARSGALARHLRVRSAYEERQLRRRYASASGRPFALPPTPTPHHVGVRASIDPSKGRRRRSKSRLLIFMTLDPRVQLFSIGVAHDDGAATVLPLALCPGCLWGCWLCCLLPTGHAYRLSYLVVFVCSVHISFSSGAVLHVWCSRCVTPVPSRSTRMLVPLPRRRCSLRHGAEKAVSAPESRVSALTVTPSAVSRSCRVCGVGGAGSRVSAHITHQCSG